MRSVSSPPVSLLEEWRERPDKAPLREFLVLGRAPDLPFLETAVFPAARGLGARVAVLGDAGHAPHGEAGARQAGHGYHHGAASCPGAFRPELILLLGDDACRVAVGPGGPAWPGGEDADGPWTVVATDGGASHPLLADLADWLEALPDAVAVTPWWTSHLRHVADLLLELHCRAPAFDAEEAKEGADVRLAHNLRRPLIDQFPLGPVDELRLPAASLDPQGEAPRLLRDRLLPVTTVPGVRRDASGHAETGPPHGTLVEWREGDVWHRFAGSPGLTPESLAHAVGEPGDGPARNCELAVLATVTAPALGPGPDPSEEEPPAAVRPPATPAPATVHDGPPAARPADAPPPLSGEYGTTTLFGDPSTARRFEQDIARLRELGSEETEFPTVADCRWTLGSELTRLAFGPLAADEGEGGGRGGESGPAVLPDGAREQAREWIGGLAHRLASEKDTGDPTRVRPWSPPTSLLVTALHLRLLAAGAWDEDDYGWRAVTADLLGVLHAADRPADGDLPGDQEERLDAVIAVCVSLLGLHGEFEGPEADPVAAAAWRLGRAAVARALPERAADLCLPAGRRGAPVAAGTDVEALGERARSVPDPVAEAHRALAAAHLPGTYEDGVWHLAGEFSNPQAACAKAVTVVAGLPGDLWPGPVLARARGRGAGVPCFMAWHRPLLVRQRGRQWTAFRILAPATPLATFQSGAPRPTAQDEQARRDLGPLLTEAGVDPLHLFFLLRD
ncbi:hypothetical protein [Streptomyces griseus]|uniref:hypothetical protein n=1 Tax=Streptomyces griseus TaxID=1911 RepID=UPI00131E2223|nr:hypothetical protein [Streptomyces griseus]